MNQKTIFYFIILIFLSFIYLKCSFHKKEIIERYTNDYSDSLITSLKRNVLLGDSNCYKQLRVVYLEEPLSDFLPYCKIMADKYNYGPAYYDVYYIILKSRNLIIYSPELLDYKT